MRKAATGPSLELALDRLPLLREFAPDQIERLRSWLEPVAWPAGHVVFRRGGDPGSSLYLVTGAAPASISCTTTATSG